jgi:hypothetical protein
MSTELTDMPHRKLASLRGIASLKNSSNGCITPKPVKRGQKERKIPFEGIS